MHGINVPLYVCAHGKSAECARGSLEVNTIECCKVERGSRRHPGIIMSCPVAQHKKSACDRPMAERACAYIGTYGELVGRSTRI